jgi:hypothetical protein
VSGAKGFALRARGLLASAVGWAGGVGWFSYLHPPTPTAYSSLRAPSLRSGLAGALAPGFALRARATALVFRPDFLRAQIVAALLMHRVVHKGLGKTR